MSVVFYFMDGCPACEATWPTWKKVKKMAKGKVSMKEVESKQMPPGTGVQSFPTFVVKDEEGNEVKRIEGRQTDAGVLMRELGVKKGGRRKKTLRRYRSRARTTRRRIH